MEITDTAFLHDGKENRCPGWLPSTYLTPLVLTLRLETSSSHQIGKATKPLYHFWVVQTPKAAQS